MQKRKVKKPIIEVHNLYGGYGSVQIINDISLTVDKDEIVSIIGPNGSGKSTFMKIIFGLATYYSGMIRFLGEETSRFRTDTLVNMGIAYVPQRENVFHDLTVIENLKMGAYLIKESILQDLNWIYQMFPELEKKKYELALNLSGGQRQMLAIGRALMSKPKILLLDEPTAALAPLLVQLILERISELRNEGLTVLLVEQNAKSALKYSDYGYVFANGKVVFHSDADTLAKADLGKLFLGMKPEVFD